MEPRDCLKGKRVLIKALGCRTNLYEAEAIASDFKKAGASVAEGPPWDIGILVSCSVTAQADSKCRQVIRRFRRSNPRGLVAAAGCWAQGLSQEEASSLGLDLVVGNRQKDRLLDLVIRIFQGEGPLTLKGDVMKDPRWEDLSLDKPTFHTRAFIKIQEGCDHFCSYCLIPFLRGKPVSRPLDSILREVRSVSEGGCKEAVLTGIHLGLYGKDLGETLASVIKSVGEVPGIKRIRLGSLEPFSLKDDLLLTMRDTVQFCPHLHLPLQSGDDSILRAMKRGHSSKDYLDLLDRIRKILGDGVHISTDVLVGFPGEDRRAFENTLEVLKKGAIGRVHVFPFSPRKGTAAFSFQDRPSRQTAEERCLEVMDLGRSLMENYSKKWLGREVSVLVEGSKDRNIWGYTSHFLKVKAKGSSAVSSICGVFIDTFEGRELRGKVI